MKRNLKKKSPAAKTRGGLGWKAHTTYDGGVWVGKETSLKIVEKLQGEKETELIDALDPP